MGGYQSHISHISFCGIRNASVHRIVSPLPRDQLGTRRGLRTNSRSIVAYRGCLVELGAIFAMAPLMPQLARSMPRSLRLALEGKAHRERLLEVGFDPSRFSLL
jgi:hypothetical protein